MIASHGMGHQRQIGSDDTLLIRAPNKSHSITGGVGFPVYHCTVADSQAGTTSSGAPHAHDMQ